MLKTFDPQAGLKVYLYLILIINHVLNLKGKMNNVTANKRVPAICKLKHDHQLPPPLVYPAFMICVVYQYKEEGVGGYRHHGRHFCCHQ